MGEITASDKEFTIELFADDTRALLDALGIERAHVLGWSLGTYIAQELAVRRPDKVEKLILYAGDCGGKEAIYPSPEILDILSDTSASPEERLNPAKYRPVRIADAEIAQVTGGAGAKRYMLRNPDNDKYASNSEENS